MQTLSQLLATCEQRGDRMVAEVASDWEQGRSLFGGVQAALAAQAMLPFSAGLPVRTMQATLSAPVPCGTISVQAEMLRQGGNTRQVQARLLDGDTTLALFVAIFGRSRESAVAHDMMRPSLPVADQSPMPYRPAEAPEFVQQFDAEILRGHAPGSSQADVDHLFRLSLRDEAPRASLAHVLALADYPPPVAQSWLDSKVPGSTMTWMLNFTGHPFEGQRLENWLIDVNLDSARDGYTQQTVSLFAPDGHAVARGTQCMVVFG